MAIEKNNDLSAGEKLSGIFRLQKAFDQCRLNNDSVYAQMLHRIGVLQFSTGKLNEAISYTLASIKINTSGKKESNKKLAVKSYYNLGYYYAGLNRLKDALNYYDLCIETGNFFKDSLTLINVIAARNRKAHIYYQTGDFQRAIEESALGLKTAYDIKNSVITIDLFNEQAQAYAAVQQIKNAVTDINKASVLIAKGDYEALANNYKIKAAISEAGNNYIEAIAYYKKAIQVRSKASDPDLSDDYLDAGNALRREVIRKNTGDFSKPISYYTESLILAQKSGNTFAAVKASNNLAAISFRTKKYSAALTGYHKSLLNLVLPFKNNNELHNPTYFQCNSISDKNFLSLLLANKTECLLYL
ncbi:MAG: tetratricopeptide repeat protein, partial [Ginsengibacter sp.]